MFEEDPRYYGETLGGKLVWNHKAFGARVAAVRFGEGPLWLLADHRPAGTCMPIFEVDNLEKSIGELEVRGARPNKGSLEIPNGPCCVFRDHSGNEFAIFQNDRPNALQQE